MDFKINGGRRLDGKVSIESAKNSVLPIMAAAIMLSGQTVIKNCPKIADVLNMSEIIESCGAKTDFIGNDLVIVPEKAANVGFSEQVSKSVRTSVLMLGALCAKYGKAVVPYPGGCDIGGRPVDIHIKALKDLGAVITEEKGFIVCSSPVKGGKTVLPFPSVGATENAILAAAFSEGESVICNAAKEPEIVDLAEFINLAGGRVCGAGTAIIRVSGVKRLVGVEFTPSFDRIEAGTYLVAAAITGGEAELKGVKAENISALLGKLCDNACKIKIKNDIIYIRGGRTRKAFSLSTGPYPLFPTDMQAQACALAAVSGGVSEISETVFTQRFHHIGELIKMGAKIRLKDNTAEIDGVIRLHGTTVCAHDLRCGAAMVLAGLNAEGITTVKDIRHLERGYYRMDEKLAALGADVVRE